MKQNEIEKFNINIGDNNKFEGDFTGRDNYKPGGDFIAGNKITGTGSKIYEVNKQNVFIEKIIAPYLIKKYGRKKVGIIASISIIAGLLTILTWLNSTPIGKLISYFPNFPENVSYWVLVIGFILLLVGLILLMARNYQLSTKCENPECGEDFAYEEITNPIRIDTRAEEGIWRIVTRTYECKYCGHLLKKKSPPFLVKDKVYK